MTTTASLVCGNLRPEDDLMHPVSAHVSHNESMFFNFFDNEQRLGGFVRIGNRLNERHAEMTFCLFLPNGELLMQWGRPVIDSNDRFEAAGLVFQVVDPGKRLAVRYEGDVARIADPDAMQNPGKAFRESPRCAVRLELDITAAGPMIGDREGRPGSVIFLDGVGHYQQPITASGELVSGNDRWHTQMRGVRDHSWGARIWHSIYRDRSIWLSFGPELTIIACKTWLSPDGNPDEMGCIVEDGKVTPLRSVVMRSRFRKGTYYHDVVQLELVAVDGRSFDLDGEVLAYVPLRHRKEGQETVYLGQAMTRFTLANRSTIGLSEYFDAASATGSLVDLSRRNERAVE